MHAAYLPTLITPSLHLPQPCMTMARQALQTEAAPSDLKVSDGDSILKIL
jgi:hypothetical protein